MTRNLILVPTESERDILQPLITSAVGANDRVELCGFGLVAAAALTAQHIGVHRPERVMLAGIAGTLRDDLPVGTAAVFDRVSCFGIGAGSGEEHQTAGAMGWHHVGGQVSDDNDDGPIITDTIVLRETDSDLANRPLELLSVAAVSGNESDAAIRRRQFPDAAAEDMEGFAVATSCHLAKVPVSIIRGFSNEVGDREIANWRIKPALKAAAELLKQSLAAV